MSLSNLSKNSGGQNKQLSPAAGLNTFFKQHKQQLELALPKHLTADRMCRLALTEFSKNPALQKCTTNSIFASVVIASQLGLEIGIGGQGYLVPYGDTCTFIPGWKGLVDLMSRSGRGSAWTAAVYDGDEFDYALGTRPYVNHRPGDESDPERITHVYAIGYVKDSEHPIIEVWSISKVLKHRDKFNKVGKRHYSYSNVEMYARKIPLLQVLKYMPQSIEMANALEASTAAEEGRGVTIDGDVVVQDYSENQPAEKKTQPKAKVINSKKDGATFAQINDDINNALSGDYIDTVIDNHISHLPVDQQAELRDIASNKKHDLKVNSN